MLFHTDESGKFEAIKVDDINKTYSGFTRQRELDVRAGGEVIEAASIIAYGASLDYTKGVSFGAGLTEAQITDGGVITIKAVEQAEPAAVVARDTAAEHMRLRGLDPEEVAQNRAAEQAEHDAAAAAREEALQQAQIAAAAEAEARASDPNIGFNLQGPQYFESVEQDASAVAAQAQQENSGFNLIGPTPLEPAPEVAESEATASVEPAAGEPEIDPMTQGRIRIAEQTLQNVIAQADSAGVMFEGAGLGGAQAKACEMFLAQTGYRFVLESAAQLDAVGVNMTDAIQISADGEITIDGDKLPMEAQSLKDELQTLAERGVATPEQLADYQTKCDAPSMN